ncbi:hypothetical protein EG346_17080 [Chryseobacterium carnipullorum]|uniref:Uncharacterized protein n=1 Tax=Chryseobacterium carnipullorum TaxID=1124835 RepID=A0A376DU99_CHRCU|nr:hypothetical protein [Chryseobacterium carnipullorum]AZA49788.1 hypothetical protein EG346_17080 [Chryseobacterium carnipullorum]AZA64680.1 hypothetical protein EG345_08110 [Chryseobacterium carnipullorum]STC95733.1 Uncharacterised protein [Chryseobacterium carnipullorum]
MKTFKNDWCIIFLLKYKKFKNIKNRFQLWCLLRSNPSFKEDEDLKVILLNKGYLVDLSGYESQQDPDTGHWLARPSNIPEILQTSKLGEKAVFSSELKSEKSEEFYDKTIVRWGALIGGSYSIYMVGVDFFRYIMDNFF